MSEVIIDTNVAVVANRQNAEVTDQCVGACIRFLMAARAEHVILLDQGDEIRQEYARAIKTSPPTTPGALFLIHVLQHQHVGTLARRIELKKHDTGEFMDFPAAPELATFDPSDRKFAALARVSRVAVTNATDSDWINSIAALQAHGIDVNFLCGCDPTQWFKG